MNDTQRRCKIIEVKEKIERAKTDTEREVLLALLDYLKGKDK